MSLLHSKLTDKENSNDSSNVLKLKTASGKEILSLTPKPDSKRASIFGTPLKPQTAVAVEPEDKADDLEFDVVVASTPATASTKPVRSEFERLIATLTNAELDVEEYRKEYERIQVEGKQLYEAYEAKCARLKDVVGRQDALSLELKAKEEQISAAEEGRAAVEKERDQWRTKYEEVKASFRDNFAAFKQLKEENARLRAGRPDAKQPGEGADEEKAALLARIAVLEALTQAPAPRPVHTTATVDRRSVAEFERLVAEFAQNQRLYSAAHGRLQARGQSLARAGEPAEVAALQAALAEEQLEVAALRADHHRLATFSEDERQRLAAALAQASESAAEGKEAILSSALAAAEQRAAALDREVATWRARTAEMESTAAHLEAETANSAAALAAARADSKKLRAAADEAEGSAEAARAEAAEAEARCAGLATLVEAQTAELQARQREFEDALARRDRAAAAQAASQAGRSEALEQQLAAQAELEGLLQAALDDLAAAQLVYVEAQAAAAASSREHGQREEVAGALREQCERLQGEVRRKSSECSLLQDNYDNLCRLLKTVETDAAARKKQLAATVSEQRAVHRALAQLAAALGVTPARDEVAPALLARLQQAASRADSWTAEEQEAAVSQVAALQAELSAARLDLLLAVKEKKEAQLTVEVVLAGLANPALVEMAGLLRDKLALQSQLSTTQARLEAAVKC